MKGLLFFCVCSFPGLCGDAPLHVPHHSQKPVTPTGQTDVAPVTPIYTRPVKPIGHTSQTNLHNQVRHVSTEKVHTFES
jgi:hypothetical protein